MSNHTIAVWSAVGGIGASLLAAELAYQLSSKVGTIVLDFCDGSIADYYGFAAGEKNKSPSSARNYPRKADREFVPHPKRASLELYIPSDDLTRRPDYLRLVERSRIKCQFTVIDLPHSLHVPAVHEVLSSADSILCLTEYQWSTILLTHNALESMGADVRARVRLVVNRDTWLPQDVVQECRKNLGRPVKYSLPEVPPATTVSFADYRPIPLSIFSPLSKAVGAISKEYLEAYSRATRR